MDIGTKGLVAWQVLFENLPRFQKVATMMSSNKAFLWALSNHATTTSPKAFVLPETRCPPAALTGRPRRRRTPWGTPAMWKGWVQFADFPASLAARVEPIPAGSAQLAPQASPAHSERHWEMVWWRWDQWQCLMRLEIVSNYWHYWIPSDSNPPTPSAHLHNSRSFFFVSS